MKGRLFHEHSASSPGDIALSSWEYEDLVDSVNDARLSPNALMRFKNLYRQHSMCLIGVPIITFPIAFFINKWIVGILFLLVRFCFQGNGLKQIQFSRNDLNLSNHIVLGIHPPYSKKILHRTAG